jgi:hypothetical protein
LGAYLLEQLEQRGFESDTILLYRAYRSEEGREALLSATSVADLIVLAFPLYVDCLPALTIRALEDIAAYRQAGSTRDGQQLAAIVNCGFPESSQNETALRICQQFAREAGLEWAGGLALGAGQSINGRPLAGLGGMVRNIAAALDMAAGALAEGGSVPQEAVTAMASPMMPAWTYSLFGGIGWRLQARQHGAQRKLNARPYERG